MLVDVLESNSDLAYKDTLNEVILCNAFLYYLFAYMKTLILVLSMHLIKI